MPSGKTSRIVVGIGGWTFEPWRGVFYPEGLTQKLELEYASRHVTSIEVNGTYYGSQKPDSFAKWYDETPDDFIFSLKGPRFATNRKILAEAGSSIERFLESGVLLLKEKLGPINWQFMPTKKFEFGDFEAFLKLLPMELDGRAIRHVVEVRHESFKTPDFIELARAYDVAIAMADREDFPAIADVTAPFVYLRLQSSSDKAKTGYPPKALDAWANKAKLWAKGKIPNDHALLAKPEAKPPAGRDVFVYFIGGHKVSNPAAAMALIERLK
jgi:uncharacterized protein YecE (DUF72 family)